MQQAQDRIESTMAIIIIISINVNYTFVFWPEVKMASNQKTRQARRRPKKVCYKTMHFTIALRRGEKVVPVLVLVPLCMCAVGRQYITVNLDYLWLLRVPCFVPKTVKFSLAWAPACAMDYSHKVHLPSQRWLLNDLLFSIRYTSIPLCRS